MIFTCHAKDFKFHFESNGMPLQGVKKAYDMICLVFQNNDPDHNVPKCTYYLFVAKEKKKLGHKD